MALVVKTGGVGNDGFWIVPEAVADLPAILAGFDRPWWVAGGWAIDLFVGGAGRAHEDVEIAVLFDDQDALRAALAGWELHVAHDGRLTPWPPGDRLALPRHQLWARRADDAPWSLEILFERSDGDDWVFRRDERIRRPLSALGTVAGGLPVVAPEVQLLFKAKSPRPRDEHDFRIARPLLSEDAATWLREALALVEPGHPWLAHLWTPPDPAPASEPGAKSVAQRPETSHDPR